MPDNAHNQHIDDSLANFTDQLMRAPNQGENGPAAAVGQDELASLQATVLQIQRAVPDQQPSSRFLARLRVVLLAEYRHLHQEHSASRQPARPSWRQRLANLFRAPERALTLRLALVAVTLLAFTLFIFPPISPGLPGAAGMSSFRPWAALGVGAVCIALVIWLARKK